MFLATLSLCAALGTIYDNAYTKASKDVPYPDMIYLIEQQYQGSDDGFTIIVNVVTKAYIDQLNKENHRADVIANCEESLKTNSSKKVMAQL